MRNPLVSIGIPVFNGQRYLSETLDSLLAQTYSNLEIIILDNISTDDTKKICMKYQSQDHRIRYYLDKTRVDVMEGHRKVAGYARGEFYLIACDDDFYAPTYISKLMDIICENPNIGLAYSGLGKISEKSTISPAHLKNKYFLKSTNSKLYNFAFYLLHRCPIPLSFGLIRTNLHKESLSFFFRVDDIFWNHDNLYMLRLLSMTKVSSTKEVLFYYRERDRTELYNKRGETDPSTYPFLKRNIYWIQHQFRIARVVSKIINIAPFSRSEKLYLGIYNIVIFIFYCCIIRLIITIKRFTQTKS